MGFQQRFEKPVRPFAPKPKRFIRKKLRGTAERPRLVVFRSLKNIYGQLIDDSARKTITTISSRSKELQEELNKLPDQNGAARIVGRAIAAKAISMDIKRIIFDRNGFPYHGRVKDLAEGAREGGLMF